MGLGLGQVMGQASGSGSWNIVTLKYKINSHWSLFSEGQIRSLRFYDQFHYYEYKAGFNYKLQDNVILSLGMGNYVTYQEGGDFVTPKNNDEFRLWPMVTILDPIGRIVVEHRYRAEQRFTINGYKRRYRYRLGILIPISREKVASKTLYAVVNNEIFFTDRSPYFERNRFLISLGYKFTSVFSATMGYLKQFDYKINDEIGKGFIQIGVQFDFNRKKKSDGDEQ